MLLAVWALWQLVSIFMRSPQQQVLDAQQEFFDAVERRDWDEVKEWMTADYGDELGQDRERAIANAREALKPFFTLEIEDEVTRSLAVKDLGEVNVKMHLKGTGAGYTQLVIDQVNMRMQQGPVLLGEIGCKSPPTTSSTLKEIEMLS